MGDENVLNLWEWLLNCGYSKATEFVLQVDELYAVKLYSVKLLKDKRHPIHKKSRYGFSIKGGQADPVPSIRVQLQKKHCVPHILILLQVKTLPLPPRISNYSSGCSW